MQQHAQSAKRTVLLERLYWVLGRLI